MLQLLGDDWVWSARVLELNDFYPMLLSCLLSTEEVPLHDGVEDASKSVVVEVIDNDGVEVTQESRSHYVTTSSYLSQKPSHTI